MSSCFSCVPALVVCAIFFTGCTTPFIPSAALNPPTNTSEPVKVNAWLEKVEITDDEMGFLERKATIETALTNNLLGFLREGKYFQSVELLPGRPHPDDYMLHVRFDRYRFQHSTWGFQNYHGTDMLATLTITKPHGQVIKEVTSSVKEEHPVASGSTEARFPSNTAPRTQLIEDLLRKALGSR
jgi:hypothetical protein